MRSEEFLDYLLAKRSKYLWLNSITFDRNKDRLKWSESAGYLLYSVVLRKGCGRKYRFLDVVKEILSLSLTDVLHFW